MLDRLFFVIGEGLSAFRRNGFMAFAAISTIAISLFILGGLGHLYVRVSDYSKTVTGKFEMRIFLVDGVTQQQIHQAADAIRALPGVAEVAHIPRKAAWAREQHLHPDLTVGIENPFPDAFKVRLNDLKQGDHVAAAAQAMDSTAVDGVQYLKDEQQMVEQLLTFVRWLSSLGALLFVTAGILIYNAIRLAVISRRLEIRIQQLVGASRFMVAAPFVLEGILHGLIGGGFASAMVFSANQLIVKRLAFMGSNLQPSSFPTVMMVGLLCSAGCVYGIVCSMLAVRVPVKPL